MKNKEHIKALIWCLAITLTLFILRITGVIVPCTLDKMGWY